MEKRERELLEETHDTVERLETLLIGIPNTDDRGLVGEVKKINGNIITLFERHNKLNRNFWILVSSLAGSGVLGGSIGLWQFLLK